MPGFFVVLGLLLWNELMQGRLTAELTTEPNPGCSLGSRAVEQGPPPSP